MSVVYILAGASGIIYHASELTNLFSQPDQAWIFIVRLLAIVGGVFAFRGANWARWLLVAWILYHVYLSFFHETAQLVMHSALAVITVVAFFYRKANAFFR
jgi:hypothetical protein